MKEKSWVWTVITQLSLCIAAYIALNSGQPQNDTYGNNSFSKGRSMDMYFISVAGGFRPLQEQTLLLKQMANVAKTYKARFVVDISELGDSDPLLQNATFYSELQTMPWYVTGAVEKQGKTYFVKKIKLDYGRTLYIIAVDTVLFQDPSSVHGNDQIHWLTRILEESDSDWRIVVGFNQLVLFEPLQKILLHYGVDAYINTSAMDKTPYLTAPNQNLVYKREMRGGFLLHQVSSLEMVTFCVKMTGEIEHQVSFPQWGKAVM